MKQKIMIYTVLVILIVVGTLILINSNLYTNETFDELNEVETYSKYIEFFEEELKLKLEMNSGIDKATISLGIDESGIAIDEHNISIAIEVNEGFDIESSSTIIDFVGSCLEDVDNNLIELSVLEAN